jgi:hypothetical protein
MDESAPSASYATRVDFRSGPHTVTVAVADPAEGPLKITVAPESVCALLTSGLLYM